MLLKYLSLILLLFLNIKYSDCQQCKEIEENQRLDCAPDKPNNSEVCSERKCCFSKTNSTNGMHFNKIYN